MLNKLTSPMGSPHLGATSAQYRNRMPAQFRRLLPLYVVVVVFVLFFFNLNLFRTATRENAVVQPAATTNNDIPKVVRDQFPKKIWQTWKVDPFAFEKKNLDVAKSWTTKNPDWRYEVLTDGNDIHYVEFHYGADGFNRTDIVDFYRSVKAAIVKADLLRYLIMYAEGGLYADIDVESLKPMAKFIPERYNQRDIDMVVGVEIDEPDWKDHPILGPKSRSFCQWTFMCKPQLPVMMRLIEQIMAWLTEVAHQQGVELAKVDLDFDQIISGTGPSAFTNAIIAEMDNAADVKKKIEWDTFHDMDESKIVSRVLVLTVEAFAAGQGHSNSGNHDARAALVKHHYHASGWPTKHPRFKHPAYGEVESCNWKDECVNKWDKDVAEFEKLSPEEQQRIIAEKKKEREELEEKKKQEKEAAAKKKQNEEDARKKKEEEERLAKEMKEKEAANREKEANKGKGPVNEDDKTEEGAEKPKELKEGEKVEEKKKEKTK
ncbi:nucleotide-diphospho-sugar transferase [Bombardia bombarda]|uniref:Nucleotide-diphospho-sugar transferase n=1 Tax=Bombardia bombarda TaxID=252184 RepID=A0AA39XNN1_9PEZI|nr:nucleotide-diphospho-sugar transferase [Bombardia bombarda]